MKFLHITDLHLVAPGNRLNGLDPERRFAPCIDDINDHHADAECCVITGDLADTGETDAYELLQREVERCRVPCHLLVGNHDHRKRFLEWFPDATQQDGFVQAAIDTSAGVFLLLDTVHTGVHSGEYCAARRAWLETQLQANTHRDVFLFMHHPPFDLHLPCIDRIGLADRALFAQLIDPYRGSIRHLFFGHAHRPLSGHWRGISYSSLRGTNHQVGLDFDTRRIAYVDEPPEYGVVFVDDDQIVVHSHQYPLLLD